MNWKSWCFGIAKWQTIAEISIVVIMIVFTIIVVTSETCSGSETNSLARIQPVGIGATWE